MLAGLLFCGFMGSLGGTAAADESDACLSAPLDGQKLQKAGKLLDAHDKASDLAIAADCYIDKPLEIVEGTPEIRPHPMMMMARMSSNGDNGTPAADPGQIEISADVTVTYDLFYK